MKKIKQIIWLIPLVILFMANISLGQLLVEDFSYPAGDSLGAHGWVNFSGSATNRFMVVSPGLTYASYIGSGVGNATHLSNNGQDDYKQFDSVKTGSVYFAMMVRIDSAKTGTGDYFLAMLPNNSTSNFTARVYVHDSTGSGNIAFGLIKSTTSTGPLVYGAPSFSYGTVYVLVLKYTFNTGTNTDDQMYLYAFSSTLPLTEPGTPYVGPVTSTQTDAPNISRLALRQGSVSTAATLGLDGIRVGTNWASVIPPVGPVPAITVNSTLTPFLTTVGIPSASQTYTISGTNLTDSLIVIAPANFEIRENGIGTFGSWLAFEQTGGTVPTKTIEVRVNSGTAGTYNSNIIDSSNGAVTQYVAVTGAVNTLYYNKSGLNLDDNTNWGTDPDGNGPTPSNFSDPNQTFMIVNGTNPPMSAAWSVLGGFSKAILGDGVNPISLTINSTYALSGTIDVSALGTLKLQNTILPTFGTLDANSTVSFEQVVPAVMPAGTYGNLKAVGSKKTFASGNTYVLGSLTADAVTDFDGSATPFSTVSLAKDFTLMNGTTFTDTSLYRLTLICNGSSPQTLMGNGSDFKIFRITVQNPTGVTLASTSNLVLGNASGGGYSLLSGDLQVGDNTLSFYHYGKAIITGGGTGSLICAVTSNLYFSSEGTNNIGTLKLKSGFETVNNFTLDILGAGTNKILTLGSNLIVNGTLNMTNGKITLGTNNLTLTNSAAPINGGSASSYIITNSTGVLSQNLLNDDTYKSFPVGPKDSSYNPVNIKLDVASTPDAFAVKVSNTITNPPVQPTQVINKEWDISEGTPGGSNATIQFLFGLADFGAAFDTTLSSYDIGHYSSGYTVYNGNLSGSVNGLFTITSASAISSFSPFIVGNNGSVTGASPLNLGLTAMLSGYCDGTNMLYTKDVTVELHSATTPYTLVESKVVTLSTTGTGNPVYTTAVNGTPYYIVLKTDNGLETWSATPQTFTGSTLSYDFTGDATQAYGSNMQLVGSKWCIISGDVNQDASVDALDRSVCWNERNLSGIYASDLNGDGTVDALDRSIAWNNRNLTVAKPALVATPNGKQVKQDTKVKTGNKKDSYDLKLDTKTAKKVIKKNNN